MYFSKILSAGPQTSAAQTKQKVDRTSLQQAGNALMTLLAIQTSLSVILLVFGPCYIQLALQLVLPARYLYTSAPSVLAAWVWYIPALAINGGLEAFVSSAALPQDVNRQSRWVVLPNYMNSPLTLFVDGWLRFLLYLSLAL